MSEKDIIIMSAKELSRVSVIHKVLEKEISQAKAAQVLGLSTRQVRRIGKRVKEEGSSGIVHRSRGKPSGRKLSKNLRGEVTRLCQEKYLGFGPTLANEKLLELAGIKISTQTLRNWLLAEGLWQKRKKSRKHKQWRLRKDCRGEMVQMDGSHHDWLEGRGPELVLMGYIDDASNEVFARFYDYEGTIPAMDSFKGYIEQEGIPQSVYLDRHSTYKSTAKLTLEDELNNTRPLTQFGRALEELGVQVIHANSPQAKGRIERLFGTFQDRLIKEMRLRDIKTKEEANRFLEYYLPIYNQRFSLEPAQKVDLHRPVPQQLDLGDILCIKHKRTLRNDHAISYNKKLYQILDSVASKQVIVHEKIDGALLIKHNDKSLRYKEISARPIKENVTTLEVFIKQKKYIPAKDHPWRKSLSSRTGHF